MEIVVACFACGFLAILFVFGLYVVDPGLPRSHPRTVRRRIYATGVVCALGPGIIYLLLFRSEGINFPTFLSLLGIRWNRLLTATLSPCALVLLLYTGCLIQFILEGESWRNITFKRNDLILRDYFVAPFAEELIFRACMLTILSSAIGNYWAISISPLFFGLAHLHHLIEWFRVKDGTFCQACATVLLQVAYTSVFGLFAAFVFLRTRHLSGIVLAHSLCNMMGLPPIEEAFYHPRKYCIMTSYIIGLILFVILLLPVTEPSLYSIQN